MEVKYTIGIRVIKIENSRRLNSTKRGKLINKIAKDVVILISFFPSPWPDELLYSVLARYHLYSGNLSGRATNTDLFNDSVYKAVAGLPSHLGQISKLMKGLYTPEEIIQKHTLFPYYSAFLPKDRSNSIKKSMIEDRGEVIHVQIGLPASTVKMPTNYRVCSQCFEEDEKQYGLPYWHRSHQLPGVFLCYKHGCVLKNSVVSCYIRRNQQEYIQLRRELIGIDAVQIANVVLRDHLFVIASESHELLNCSLQYPDVSLLTAIYKSKLSRLGGDDTSRELKV